MIKWSDPPVVIPVVLIILTIIVGRYNGML